MLSSAPRNATPNIASTRGGTSPSSVTSNGPRSGQYPTARMTVGTTRFTAPAQPSGHQRRDGRRPSGNSRIRNTTPTTMPGTMVQLANQLATSPPGSDSCREVRPRASGAYCAAKLNTARETPPTRNSQASRWRRSPTTISAPTSGRTSASRMPMAWWFSTSSTGDSPLKVASAMLATARVTDRRHSAQASQVTAGRRARCWAAVVTVCALPRCGGPWSIAASHHGTVTTWSSALVGFATPLRQETPPRGGGSRSAGADQRRVEPGLLVAHQAKPAEGGNDPVVLGVGERHRINRPAFHDRLLERGVAAPQQRVGAQGVSKAAHGGHLRAGSRHHVHVDAVVGPSVAEGAPHHRPRGREGRRDL